MKLSRNIRFVIAIVASVLIALANVSIIINPTIDGIVEAKKDHQINESKINDLVKLEKEKDERKKKEKFYRYELELVTEKLPNNIVPETFITQLKRFVEKNNVVVQNILFTTPDVIGVQGIAPVTANDELMQKANNSIYNLFKDSSLENTKASDNLLQYSGILDDNIIKVDVSFDFEGQYENVKNFINYLELEGKRLREEAENKISINKINFAGRNEEENTIAGSMIISFYGIKDSNIPIYELWKKDIARGKLNFFSYEGSERFDINNTSTSDFDIKLHPVTSDYPSVVMGRNGEYGTKIYGDNSKNEQVTIELVGENGEYRYRYKTQSISYPLNYSWKSFEPKTSKNIIVKIYSTPRLQDSKTNKSDEAGIDLKIVNDTDRKINVITYNDDNDKPRVQYSVENLRKPPVKEVTQPSVEEPVTPIVEQPVDPASEEPVMSAEDSANVEETVDSTEPVVEEPVENTIEESTQPVVEQPINESTQPIVEQPVENTAEESIEPMVEQPIENTIEESSEPQVGESTE